MTCKNDSKGLKECDKLEEDQFNWEGYSCNSADPNAEMYFFPEHFRANSNLMGDEKHSNTSDSNFKADTTNGSANYRYTPLPTHFNKLEKKAFYVNKIPKGTSMETIQEKFQIARQGFTLVDLNENKQIMQLLDENSENLRRVNVEGDAMPYQPEFGTKMRAGQEEFLMEWVPKQQELGRMDQWEFDDSPIVVNSVLVQSGSRNSTATGAFFAHMDLKLGATIVEYFRQIGDTWLPHIFNRNSKIRALAAIVFRQELLEFFSPAEIDALSGKDYSEQIGVELQKLLALDLLVDLESKVWKPQKEAGLRFWQYVKVQEVLNFWVALVPDGLSSSTSTNSFGMLDYHAGYDRKSDLVQYTSTRSWRGRDTLLPRSPTFLPYGVKYRDSHTWWTMEDMRYGQAYIWRSPASPHGAVTHKDNVLHDGRAGCRVSMDSQILFLKIDEGLLV